MHSLRSVAFPQNVMTPLPTKRQNAPTNKQILSSWLSLGLSIDKV